jgi:hypothetical protein
MEAGTLDLEPEILKWVMELHGVWEENADETNARIYEINHEKPWSDIRQNLDCTILIP